jgi:GNAT superfamily N-acetyltransferase
MAAMGEVDFTHETDGVDWAALKAALAADAFDNGRTAEEYQLSHERSHAVVFAWDDGRPVGNGRVLSDGVCNAYLVDIWTASTHRRRGIGRAMVDSLVATVPGQHVGLFTDDMQDFYRALGFNLEHDGMSRVVGSWLGR